MLPSTLMSPRMSFKKDKASPVRIVNKELLALPSLGKWNNSMRLGNQSPRSTSSRLFPSISCASAASTRASVSPAGLSQRRNHERRESVERPAISRNYANSLQQSTKDNLALYESRFTLQALLQKESSKSGRHCSIGINKTIVLPETPFESSAESPYTSSSYYKRTSHENKENLQPEMPVFFQKDLHREAKQYASQERIFLPNRLVYSPQGQQQNSLESLHCFDANISIESIELDSTPEADLSLTLAPVERRSTNQSCNSSFSSSSSVSHFNFSQCSDTVEASSPLSPDAYQLKHKFTVAGDLTICNLSSILIKGDSMSVSGETTPKAAFRNSYDEGTTPKAYSPIWQQSPPPNTVNRCVEESQLAPSQFIIRPILVSQDQGNNVENLTIVSDQKTITKLDKIQMAPHRFRQSQQSSNTPKQKKVLSHFEQQQSTTGFFVPSFFRARFNREKAYKMSRARPVARLSFLPSGNQGGATVAESASIIRTRNEFEN